MVTTALASTLDLPAQEHGLSPDEIDERLAVIASAHESCESMLAFYLLEVDRRGLHRGFGYPSAAQYAEGRFRIERGTAYRLIRAAKAFEKSPLLREAFERGEVAISKVDVVESKLGRGEDAVWVERARTLTRKELRAAVEASLIEDGSEDDEISIMVRLTRSQLRIFRDAMEKCRRVAGADIGRGDALEMLSVEYLQTPIDESEREPAETASASPDGEPREPTGEAAGGECTGAPANPGVPARPAEDAARGKGSAAAWGGTPGVPARPAEDAARGKGSAAAWGGTPGVPTRPAGGDALAGEAAAAWGGTSGTEPDAERAAAFRRAVIARDGWRCTAPGCGRRVDLQVDHIRERSRRPDLRYEVTNGAVLCSPCHALKTSGRLRMTRLEDGMLTFERPDSWETFRDG